MLEILGVIAIHKETKNIGNVNFLTWEMKKKNYVVLHFENNKNIRLKYLETVEITKHKNTNKLFHDQLYYNVYYYR